MRGEESGTAQVSARRNCEERVTKVKNLGNCSGEDFDW